MAARGEPEAFASASAGSKSSTCSQIGHIQGRIAARGRAPTERLEAQDLGREKDFLTEEHLTLLQKACQFFFSHLTFFF